MPKVDKSIQCIKKNTHFSVNFDAVVLVDIKYLTFRVSLFAKNCA